MEQSVWRMIVESKFNKVTKIIENKIKVEYLLFMQTI